MIGDLAIVDASVRSTLECGGSTPPLPSSSALRPAGLSRKNRGRWCLPRPPRPPLRCESLRPARFYLFSAKIESAQDLRSLRTSATVSGDSNLRKMYAKTSRCLTRTAAIPLAIVTFLSSCFIAINSP